MTDKDRFMEIVNSFYKATFISWDSLADAIIKEGFGDKIALMMVCQDLRDSIIEKDKRIAELEHKLWKLEG